jgi:ClpP class serine protease
MSQTNPRRVLRSALSGSWYLSASWAAAMARSYDLVATSGASSPEVIREQLRATFAPLAPAGGRPSAVAADYGEPLPGARSVTVRDGVAILPVMGVLWHRASWFTELCGHTTYHGLAADLRAVRQAYAGGDVRALVLEVDSPGGEVGGCGDTAQLIRAAAGELPTVAFVSALAASAAYWLAAAASHVVVSSTSLAGGIGVVSTFRIIRGSGKGVEEVQVVSSQSPKKVLDLNSEEGQAEAQTMVDDLAQVFVDDVARYRGVSSGEVLQGFGQGGVVIGRKAVDAGMADRVSTLEEVITELAAGEYSWTSTRSSGGRPLVVGRAQLAASAAPAPAAAVPTIPLPSIPRRPAPVYAYEELEDLAAAALPIDADEQRAAEIIGLGKRLFGALR